MKQNGNPSASGDKSEQSVTPPWLDEACESCLEAARCMIRHLSGACEINRYVRVRNSSTFHHKQTDILTLDRKYTTMASTSKPPASPSPST